MRWTVRRRTVWHRWFAWRPVLVLNETGPGRLRVWLEVVERRNAFPNHSVLSSWEYRQVP